MNESDKHLYVICGQVSTLLCPKTYSSFRFVILFHLSKLVFFPFAFEKKGLCDPTLPFVKTIGPEVYKEEISIMLVSKVTIAVGAWAFLQSYQACLVICSDKPCH